MAGLPVLLVPVVVRLAQTKFGLDPGVAEHNDAMNTNANSDKACFVPDSGEVVDGTSRLAWALNDAVAVWDVRFEDDVVITSAKGKLSSIHKVRDNAAFVRAASPPEN